MVLSRATIAPGKAYARLGCDLCFRSKAKLGMVLRQGALIQLNAHCSLWVLNLQAWTEFSKY